LSGVSWFAALVVEHPLHPLLDSGSINLVVSLLSEIV
jgi:hypothetical protein